MTTYKNATCRGSYALGTACGKCERCYEEAGYTMSGMKREVTDPLQRIFTLRTGGTDKELDLLGICVEVFAEMPPVQRDRAVAYLNHRFRDAMK